MRNLLTIPTLFFTLMFSSNSFGEWKWVGENVRGDYYVDFDSIRKVDEYLYFWTLNDFLKPLEDVYFSSKVSFQGDCKLFRYKNLSMSFHKEPMGEDTGLTVNLSEEWENPLPKSSIEVTLKSVCDYVKYNVNVKTYIPL